MKLREFYRFILWEYRFLWIAFVWGLGIIMKGEMINEEV